MRTAALSAATCQVTLMDHISLVEDLLRKGNTGSRILNRTEVLTEINELLAMMNEE